MRFQRLKLNDFSRKSVPFTLINLKEFEKVFLLIRNFQAYSRLYKFCLFAYEKLLL